MIRALKFKVDWSCIGAHVCTASVAVSLNSLWRVPRHAFMYGGLPYLVVLTVAMVTVALPAALLQLAVGQLSQQDAVGVWRAVPFFKGVGYLRLLISFLISIPTAVYTALTTMYFIYALRNPFPFWDCSENAIINATEASITAEPICEETFLRPISDNSEYYIAISLISVVLWILLPFLLYNPIKFLKRGLYILGPMIAVFTITVWSGAGSISNLLSIYDNNWSYLLEANVWHAALVQALISCQVAGGFLISSGDTIYSDANVQWTSLLVILSNALASWLCGLFWYSVTTPSEDVTPIAVLIRIYNTRKQSDSGDWWLLILYFTLVLAGFISMLTLLYPIYDRFRHIGGTRWRLMSVASSVAGAGAALGLLAGREKALIALEDVAIPFLVTIVTVLEILAFIVIYGVKSLVEDIEFLTGDELKRVWVLGWWVSVVGIVSGAGWWVGPRVGDEDRVVPLAATAGMVAFIVAVSGLAVVTRQLNYGIIQKLASSFKPSRHWGPRDPITHYYWLARRGDPGRRDSTPGTRYSRRQLGQLSGAPSVLELAKQPYLSKQRAHSDDWLYTGYRKKMLELFEGCFQDRKRSKSLDWSLEGRKRKSLESVVCESSNYMTPAESVTK